MTTTEIIMAVVLGAFLGWLGGIALANYLNKPWREMAARLDAIDKERQEEGIEDVESRLIDALLRVANSPSRQLLETERPAEPQPPQE